MQSIQHVLDIIALLQIATAFALFGGHLASCLRRPVRRQAIAVARSQVQPDPWELPSEVTVEPTRLDVKPESESQKLLPPAAPTVLLLAPAQEKRKRKRKVAAKEMAEPQITVEIGPEAEPIDFSKLTVPQLRVECDKRGIHWKNARGKGKHLLKGEMVKALKSQP
jgi:hypothetical protein